jgi:hypothetical protein
MSNASTTRYATDLSRNEQHRTSRAFRSVGLPSFCCRYPGHIDRRWKHREIQERIVTAQLNAMRWRVIVRRRHALPRDRCWFGFEVRSRTGRFITNAPTAQAANGHSDAIVRSGREPLLSAACEELAVLLGRRIAQPFRDSTLRSTRGPTKTERRCVSRTQQGSSQGCSSQIVNVDHRHRWSRSARSCYEHFPVCTAQ